MSLSPKITAIFTTILDLIGSLLLAAYAFVIGPLGVVFWLPFGIVQMLANMLILLPQGLYSNYIHAAIDWRVGKYDRAIAGLEGIIGSLEESYGDSPKSKIPRDVFECLFTTLSRAYMHAGDFDNAMLVVIRAKKSLGLERLSGLSDMDAKTAHLIRAGIAAGKLLDGPGLATLFVRTDSSPIPPPPHTPGKPAQNQGTTSTPSIPQRQGAVSKVQKSSMPAANKVGGGEAKIIPFRSRDHDVSP